MVRKGLYIVLFFLCCFMVTEALCRIVGKLPHQKRDYLFTSSPKDCFVPSSIMGTRPNAGTYMVTINQHLVYRTTHVGFDSVSTYRTCYEHIAGDTLPTVDFHGCSFTYGMGVDDTDTYPYLWAKAHPQYKVHNYGCPGYAPIEALMCLQNQKLHNNLPNAIIVNYLDMHDDRNMGTVDWRESVDEGFRNGMRRAVSPATIGKFGNCRFPYARLVGDSLAVSLTPLSKLYTNFPARDYLASIYLLEKTVNYYRYNHQKPLAVSGAVFKEIASFCKQNNITLLVTTMNDSDNTHQMQAYLSAQGIEWVDISVDFSNPIYTNLPYDGHPSPTANKVFAEKLRNYLPRF